MKKTIISIAAAALCASALSAQAFAEDILSDKSVYADKDKRESIAKAAGIMDLDGYVIRVDPNTIMPYYYANLLDYARTGSLDIIPSAQRNGSDDAGETYVSDAVNADGEFAGTASFDIGGPHPGIRSVSHSSNKADSIAFEPNARRISAVMKKQKINSDCQEIKLVMVEELGNVYYIDTGTSKYLAAANLGWVNGELFNEENGGIVEINDELKAFADRKLAELEEYLKTHDPSKPPPVGGNDTPMYMVDNTPYLDSAEAPSAPDKNDNPNTGGVSSALAGGIALTACVIGIYAAKKKKDQ